MRTLFKLALLSVFSTATTFEYWLNDNESTEDPGRRNYDDAQKSCKAWGGYLAVVTEQNYIQIIKLIENTVIIRNSNDAS